MSTTLDLNLHLIFPRIRQGAREKEKISMRKKNLPRSTNDDRSIDPSIYLSMTSMTTISDAARAKRKHRRGRLNAPIEPTARAFGCARRRAGKKTKNRTRSRRENVPLSMRWMRACPWTRAPKDRRPCLRASARRRRVQSNPWSSPVVVSSLCASRKKYRRRQFRVL